MLRTCVKPGGQETQYLTTDGGKTWSLHATLAADANAYGAITRVYSAHADAQLLLCNRADNTIYLWGTSGYVGRPTD